MKENPVLVKKNRGRPKRTNLSKHYKTSTTSTRHNPPQKRFPIFFIGKIPPTFLTKTSVFEAPPPLPPEPQTV
jgi:hypothetical protein